MHERNEETEKYYEAEGSEVDPGDMCIIKRDIGIHVSRPDTFRP
jgi:hypothetical protein